MKDKGEDPAKCKATNGDEVSGAKRGPSAASRARAARGENKHAGLRSG